MNVAALFSKDAYNMICELLGANWYAVAATAGLGALAVCHIVYAFILTAQNRRARGANRYEVTAKPDKVEWASQNMLVLGIIVLLGIGLHLFNFWYNMMFAELVGMKTVLEPTDGFGLIVATFKNKLYVVLYIIWIVALWFHLSHGFWSAFATLGGNLSANSRKWLNIIALVVSVVLYAGFMIMPLCVQFGILK